MKLKPRDTKINRDDPVIVELYEREKTNYYNLALYFLRDPHLAHDMVQDAFADYLASSGNSIHKKPIEEQSKYVRKIVMRKCFKFMKANKIEFVNLEEAEENGENLTDLNADEPFEHLCFKERIEHLRIVLRKLPNQCHRYFLYYIVGYKNGEIADVLHIRSNSGSTLKHDTLKKVREGLKKLEGSWDNENV